MRPWRGWRPARNWSGEAPRLIEPRENKMKHATEIKAGEVTVGLEFRYKGGAFIDGKYVATEKIAVVKTVRVTKTGRVSFTIDDGSHWSNAAIAPTTRLQAA